MTKLLELKDVSLEGRLSSINLILQNNQKVVLLGRSGSGKSSLIELCNGSQIPDKGLVLWNGIPINNINRVNRALLGTLWQDLRLIEELNISQNINSGALGRKNFLWALRNLLGMVNHDTCIYLMKLVGLDQEIINKSVATLSGGQRQRVAIARLINQHPKFILADEPLSALDPKLSNNILKLLLKYQGSLISIHRPDLINYFDRVLGLRKGNLVLDAHPLYITDQTLSWLYSDN